MYSVSAAFLEAIRNPIVQYDLKGTIGTQSFTKENVLSGSFKIDNQCSDDSEVKIGTVYIGQLQATFIGMDLDRYTILGKDISPQIGVFLANNTYEYVPCGVFTVQEAEWSAAGLTVKAYDKMALLDKACSLSTTGTLYQMAKTACTDCGVVLANANFNNFVNGGQKQFAMFPNNDIETYRDLISWIAQTAGCFVTANRQGKIEFRTYTQTKSDTIDSYHRFRSVKFADYVTKYTGLSCVDIEDETTSYYRVLPDDGLTYNLGSNPILQYADKDNDRQNVLTALQNIQYVPFQITTVMNPAYDLGDVLELPGGLGDATKKFCITKFVLKMRGGMDLSGAGKNPALATARSKTDKDITGISKNKKDDLIQYYSFTNGDEIIIGDGETKTIIDIRYTAIKKAVAILDAEILLTADTTVDDITYHDAVGTIKHYVNETLIQDYYPTEMWRDGDHILHLLYYLHIDAGTVNHFESTMKMKGGSVTIKVGGVKACIYGQNLVASDDWGGILRITEEVPMFAMKKMTVQSATDSAAVTCTVPEIIAPVDEADLFSMKKLQFESVDDSIDMIAIIPNRKTESGVLRITEDGNIRKVDS